MNKVCSFFMVIGLAAALHVNAQGGGFITLEGDDKPMDFRQEGRQHMMGNGMSGDIMMPLQNQLNDDRRPQEGHAMFPPPRPRENEERVTVENQFYINNGTLQFKDIKFTVANGELMRVKRDKRKSKKGYGHLVLSTDSECSYEGNVYVDKKCEAQVTVDKGVTWTGYANRNKRSKQITVIVNGTWNLTDDSYINMLVIGKNAVINTNGYKLKYDSLDNQGLLN